MAVYCVHFGFMCRTRNTLDFVCEVNEVDEVSKRQWVGGREGAWVGEGVTHVTFIMTYYVTQYMESNISSNALFSRSIVTKMMVLHPQYALGTNKAGAYLSYRWGTHYYFN